MYHEIIGFTSHWVGSQQLYAEGFAGGNVLTIDSFAGTHFKTAAG
jgi:hypothetical protein